VVDPIGINAITADRDKPGGRNRVIPDDPISEKGSSRTGQIRLLNVFLDLELPATAIDEMNFWVSWPDFLRKEAFYVIQMGVGEEDMGYWG
jgi:hypothetical protein